MAGCRAAGYRRALSFATPDTWAPELLEPSADMKNYGRNSKIVAAYTTLAVVALGIITLDFAHRSKQGDLIPDFPEITLASQTPPTVPSESRNTAISTEAGATLPKMKTKSEAARRVTVATYSALGSAK